MRPSRNIFLLALVFVMVALPFAATFVMFYPDERHYFDGGFMMARDGDWLVPKHADGSPRFEKPPLAYWLVGASYRIFGVGVLATRLPFLLAGLGTLWLTCRLARRLTGNDQRALLAAVVLLSHPQFFLSSVRSMPDALLVFFITLSASGFIRVLILGERTQAVFWMAYAGAAGAVLSKGLLGVAVVLYAWGFALWWGRSTGAWRKLIHWPSMIVAFLLSTSWFAYVWLKYGNTSVGTFFDDQVTGNLHGHWWNPEIRLLEYGGVLLLNFLPWTLPALETLIRQRFRVNTELPTAARAFLLGWTALLVFGFPIGENVSLRYLLPAAPLIAILLGDWLPLGEAGRRLFTLRLLFIFMLGLLTVLAVVGWIFVAQWPAPPGLTAAMFGLFLAEIVVLGWWVLRKHSSVPTALALAATVMFVWLILFIVTVPLAVPEASQRIAVRLQKLPDQRRTVLVFGQNQLASRLRAVLGRDWQISQTDSLKSVRWADFQCVVGGNELIHQMPPGLTWQREAVAFLPLAPPTKEIWPALKAGRLPVLLEDQGMTINLFNRE